MPSDIHSLPENAVGHPPRENLFKDPPPGKTRRKNPRIPVQKLDFKAALLIRPDALLRPFFGARFNAREGRSKIAPAFPLSTRAAPPDSPGFGAARTCFNYVVYAYRSFIRTSVSISSTVPSCPSTLLSRQKS